jgi:lysophospholipase L1-like esterase
VKFKDAAGATVACFHDDGSVMLKGSMEKSDFSSVPTQNRTLFTSGGSTVFYIDQSDQSLAKFPATLYLPSATFSIAGSGNSVGIPAHDFRITDGSYGLSIKNPSTDKVLQGFRGDLGTAGNVYGLRTKYIVYENRDDVEHLPNPACQAYTPANMTDLVYALWRLKHNQNRGNRPANTMVIAFMGGSMTQGGAPSSWENWYPYQIAEYLLATLWPGPNNDGWEYLIVNAASNGHTSPLGACYSDDRVLYNGGLYTFSTSVEKDYTVKLAENPDLVIVEYSGNDHFDYEVDNRTWDTWKIQQRAYEGLLRRLLYVSGDENARKIARPGVICFSVMVANGLVSYSGTPPYSLATRVFTPATGWARTMQEKHLRIAKNYAAPVVSLRDHLWKRHLEFCYMTEPRPPNDVWVMDYTYRPPPDHHYDSTHPNDAGNGVMKDVVQSILATAISRVPALGSPPTAPAALPPRICDSLPDFEDYTSFIEGKINAYAPGSQTSLGGWTIGTTTVNVPRGIDSTNKEAPGTLGLGPVYNVPCWKADSPSDELTLSNIPAGTKEILVQHSLVNSDNDVTVQVWINGVQQSICILNAKASVTQKTLKWCTISWEVQETGSARTLTFKSFSGPQGTTFELHKVFVTGKL